MKKDEKIKAILSAINEGKTNDQIRSDIDGRLADTAINALRIKCRKTDGMTTDEAASAALAPVQVEDDEAHAEAPDEGATDGATDGAETSDAETSDDVPVIVGKMVSVYAKGKFFRYGMDSDGILEINGPDGSLLMSTNAEEFMQMVREVTKLAEMVKEMSK